MNREELIEKYAAGERDFSNLDLRNPDLAGVDLTNIKPVYGDYAKGINLSDICLEGIDLSRSILYGARLDNAKLSNANLCSMFARRATFDKVNLIGANLSLADCKQSDFRMANLSNANLSQADLSGDSDFHFTNLSNANLSNANLEAAHLNYADLSCTCLVDANLRYASISDTSICSSNLTRANLHKAELSYTDLRGSNLTHTNLSGALLNSVDLMGVDLSTVDLTGVKYRGSNLILTTAITNTSDREIVSRLRTESQIGFYSDGDYSDSFFLWEIEGKDTVTIEDILEWGTYQTETAYEVHDLSKYFRKPEDIAVYEETLIDTKIYLISEGETRVFNGVDIYVIGKTPTGNFAGYYSQPAWT